MIGDMKTEVDQFDRTLNATSKAIASVLCAELIKGVTEMDKVTCDQHVNEALASLREIESLGTEAFMHYRNIVADQCAEKLASAARLATDALGNGLGYRVWMNAAHERAINLFNRKLVDCASNDSPTALFQLVIAQTFLMSTTRAMGLLGLSIKGPAKRRPTAIRKLLPTDYPDEDIRAAVVETAFGDREIGAAYLRSRSRDPEHDQDGRISQLIAAHEAGGDLFASVQSLAGHIIAADPAMFSVSRRASVPQRNIAEANGNDVGISIAERARAVASGAA